MIINALAIDLHSVALRVFSVYFRASKNTRFLRVACEMYWSMAWALIPEPIALLAILALWLWRFLWLLDLLCFGRFLWAWFWVRFGVPFGFGFGLGFGFAFLSPELASRIDFDRLQNCLSRLVFLEGLQVCVLSICLIPRFAFLPFSQFAFLGLKSVSDWLLGACFFGFGFAWNLLRIFEP